MTEKKSRHCEEQRDAAVLGQQDTIQQIATKSATSRNDESALTRLPRANALAMTKKWTRHHAPLSQPLQ